MCIISCEKKKAKTKMRIESEGVTLRVGGLVVVFINGGVDVTLVTEKLDCGSGIEPQYRNITLNVHYTQSHTSHMTEDEIT